MLTAHRAACAAGLLTQEAAPGGTVTYTFVASSPGTHAYYSGTQGDLQVEMGLYGAVVVLPGQRSGRLHGAGCRDESWQQCGGKSGTGAKPISGSRPPPTISPKTCYDREYLFQWAEMDPKIHNAALAQVTAAGGCTAGAAGCSLNVPTEPYHPAYFMINGRSMPDLMDPNYAAEYPHQPYNGNPHMHPGEMTLIRSSARAGGSTHSTSTPTTCAFWARRQHDSRCRRHRSRRAFDVQHRHDSGRGLRRDLLLHRQRVELGSVRSQSRARATRSPRYPVLRMPTATTPAAPTAINYFEWCQDHNKPLEVAPFGDVAAGGPATLPNPNIFTNGAWYGGTPYLGPDATCATADQAGPAHGNLPACPTLQAESQANERGWAYMWHSHNEREITTNNVFPGGMLMMMLVDSREFVIDESN